MNSIGIFSPQTYRQWVDQYPDSPQVDTWLALAAQPEAVQSHLLGAGQVAPPSGNTGVQITNVALTGGLMLDWFACTVPTETTEDQGAVLRRLGELFPLQSTPFGGHGYTCGASVFETGRVYWHPDHLEMGVHVSFTSQTLASIAELLPGWDADKVLRFFVLELGARPTRVDLALDTSADVVTKAEQSLDLGDVTTRSRVFRVERPQRLGKAGQGNEIIGHSVLLGSRESETYVRLYDKRLESGGDEPWYRLEFEFKGDRSGAVAELLLAGDGDAVRGAMLAHLDFKRHSETDVNSTRWKTARWWSALLGTVTKNPIRLARTAKPSIEKIGEWLDRQVGPALTLWLSYLEVQGESPVDWLKPFYGRWGARHNLIYETFAAG